MSFEEMHATFRMETDSPVVLYRNQHEIKLWRDGSKGD